MTTHAIDRIPGGPMTLLVDKRYWQRYTHISKRWVGYRNLKCDILKVGFIAFAAMHYVDKVIRKSNNFIRDIRYGLEDFWIELKRVIENND